MGRPKLTLGHLTATQADSSIMVDVTMLPDYNSTVDLIRRCLEAQSTTERGGGVLARVRVRGGVGARVPLNLVRSVCGRMAQNLTLA